MASTIAGQGPPGPSLQLHLPGRGWGGTAVVGGLLRLKGYGMTLWALMTGQPFDLGGVAIDDGFLLLWVIRPCVSLTISPTPNLELLLIIALFTSSLPPQDFPHSLPLLIFCLPHASLAYQ